MEYNPNPERPLMAHEENPFLQPKPPIQEKLIVPGAIMAAILVVGLLFYVLFIKGIKSPTTLLSRTPQPTDTFGQTALLSSNKDDDIANQTVKALQLYYPTQVSWGALTPTTLLMHPAIVSTGSATITTLSEGKNVTYDIQKVKTAGLVADPELTKTGLTAHTDGYQRVATGQTQLVQFREKITPIKKSTSSILTCPCTVTVSVTASSFY